MQHRSLTKEDIDKVRDIDGFPIGSDEDIIALSDAPYYTACPNPFIEEFIKEYGKPYDEETDDYHREPFAADVSEKKNDVVYTAHSYHTKVPYKAIMRYILHYTKPGDVIFDGFCGTGMTGVAAQMCENPDINFKYLVESEQKDIAWGVRYAVLNDLAVAGTHISSNYNIRYDINEFSRIANQIIDECQEKYGWLYQTDAHQNSDELLLETSATGIIANTVWSNIVVCPNCGKDMVFYSVAIDSQGTVLKTIHCPHCNAEITRSQIKFKENSFYDEILGKVVTQVTQVPVFKIFVYNGSKYTGNLTDYDYGIIEKIKAFDIKSLNIPSEKMLFRDGKWGDIYRSGYHKGFTHAHHFYTKRNLIAIAALYNQIQACENKRIRHMLMFALTGALPMLNRTNRWRPAMNTARGPINGILYIPSIYPELNVFNAFLSKVKDIEKCHSTFPIDDDNVIVSTQSSTNLSNISTNTIDYIFIDPPFGDNIMYSESNFLWEAWLKVYTNQKGEAIVNSTQGKKLNDYQQIMEKCFIEFYRILKPNRWITVEFHNSKNAIWNSIQESLLRAGFIIADVRTLNKHQGSFKQVTTSGAVKQDLVISAYKPKESFIREFHLKAATEKTAWIFVRQHLSNLPVVVDSDKDGKIDILAERQAHLLFDRMISYHIMQGYAVPMDATDFYKGLDEKFLKRDGMYFLPDQVNEYDMARVTMEVENIQFSLFVMDEKSAISWLYQQLDENSGVGRQTYAELQPKFMKELQAVDKREKMPELREILEENFLKDDDGRWYIPDLTKSGDLAKLREKNLLREFQTYQESTGKLKVFRSEAVRAGFSKLWKDKNYAEIVAVAERLPEQAIQEDPNLLMYYDFSLSRV